MSGTEVWIQMHHNQPPVTPISECGPKGYVWCSQVWDSHLTFQILQEILGPEALVNGEIIETTLAERIIGLPEGMDYEPGTDVFKLIGDRHQLIMLAQHWAEMAINDCESVSGDDTYYDYYPDYLNGLAQLCRQIEYHKPIMRAVEHAALTTYRDDTEDTVVGIWED